MPTQEELNKGLLGFQNEVVNPTGQDRGVGGSVVRRYTTPVPTTNTDAIATVPSAAPTAPAPSVMSFDQFSQQRGGAIDENAIREETRKSMQAQIDAINTMTADLIAKENQAGSARLDKVRALNVNSGLGGSSFATTADLNQRDLNDKAVKSIKDEQELKLRSVLGSIDKAAKDEIAARKAEALGNAEAYTTYLDKARGEAKDQLATLAGANIDLSKVDPAHRDYLLKSAGYDPQLGELVYNSLRPKAGRVEYKVEKLDGGKVLFYGQDPETGEVKTIRMDLSIPEGYSAAYVDGQLYYKDDSTGDLSPAPMDESLYTPDYKNYLLSKKEGGFTGSFEQWQTADANRKRSVTNINYAGGDYNSKQLTALTKLNENVSKNATYGKTTSMKSYVDNVVTSLSLGSGVGDIAAINQFQKVIDEGAVTRDQDVNLIQSSQSLVNTLKSKLAKLEKGEQLSTELRAQMKTAAEKMYSAQLKALGNDPYIKSKASEAAQYGLKVEDTILGELTTFTSPGQPTTTGTTASGVNYSIEP